MDEPGTYERKRTSRASREKCAFRLLRIRDGYIRGKDVVVMVVLLTHIHYPPIPKALSGKIPFHLLSDPAVVAKVLSGGRPEEPIDTPAATHTSGLWSIVQQCWEEKPTKRPALSEVRDRLFVAAGMWDVDLGRSGSTDGFESVRQNVLLSSWDFSDAGKWVSPPLSILVFTWC